MGELTKALGLDGLLALVLAPGIGMGVAMTWVLGLRWPWNCHWCWHWCQMGDVGWGKGLGVLVVALEIWVG